MEEELGLSYPTLRNRLYDIIRALGFEPGKDETIRLTNEERMQILDELARGVISAEDAERRLLGKKDESEDK